MFIKHLQILPFILGLLIGLLVVYIFPPQRESVVKYPTPAAHDIYKDKNGVCFRYDTQEVNCDQSEDKLRDFPLQ